MSFRVTLESVLESGRTYFEADGLSAQDAKNAGRAQYRDLNTGRPCVVGAALPTAVATDADVAANGYTGFTELVAAGVFETPAGDRTAIQELQRLHDAWLSAGRANWLYGLPSNENVEIAAEEFKAALYSSPNKLRKGPVE